MRIRALTLAGALLALTSAAYADQVYKWVDEKGVVNYTTEPPPTHIKQVEEKHIGANTLQTSDVPYGVKQAVKNFPVTLYATNCGDLCDKARAHLKRRGIPFTEKNPLLPEENDAFKQLTGGGMEVPLLMVGQTKVKGYLATDWDAALDRAGYPSSSAVPPSSAPVPVPAASPAPVPAAPAPAPAAIPAP